MGGLMSTLSVLSRCPGQSRVVQTIGRMDGQDTWDRKAVAKELTSRDRMVITADSLSKSDP